jgi:hypothetical protein
MLSLKFKNAYTSWRKQTNLESYHEEAVIPNILVFFSIIIYHLLCVKYDNEQNDSPWYPRVYIPVVEDRQKI